MIKTVLLVVVAVVLGLKIFSLRQEGFDQAEIQRLRERLDRINDRLINIENLNAEILTIRNNMNNFNLEIMNNALLKLEEKFEKEDSRILKQIHKLEEQDSKHHEEVFKLTNKLHEKERTDYDKLKSHVDQLVNALNKVEKKEINNFNEIKSNISSMNKKGALNMNYLYVGLALVAFLLLLILVTK